MTTLAHLLSASYIAISAAKVLPTETNLIIISLILAGILDLDHFYFLIKNNDYFRKNGFKNNFHKARSIFHELAGFTIFGLVGLAVSFIDVKLAKVLAIPAMVHIVEDMIIGVSLPFAPFDKTEINLISQNSFVKIVVDIAVIIFFGFLWIKYLNVIN